MNAKRKFHLNGSVRKLHVIVKVSVKNPIIFSTIDEANMAKLETQGLPNDVTDRAASENSFYDKLLQAENVFRKYYSLFNFPTGETCILPRRKFCASDYVEYLT